jgi:hypothetical protein
MALEKRALTKKFQRKCYSISQENFIFTLNFLGNFILYNKALEKSQ